jgi:dolichyl-phosphate-mannose--protein O-mannosyl transferase
MSVTPQSNENNNTKGVRSAGLWLGLLVAIVALLTIVRDYSTPQNLFWDENYHVAAAQKYLNRIFFMEPHPPLGKLLIALGEYVVDANPNDAQLVTTDHAKTVPKDFSFAGYRLFPVIISAAACVVFYILLLQLTKSPLTSCFFALCVALDNALVIHFRGAMLDGIQIFFVLAFMAAIAAIYRATSDGLRSSKIRATLPYIAGAAFGLAMATKITSLIALLFLIILIQEIFKAPKRMALMGLKIFGAGLVVYLLVWKVHIQLGRSIKSELPDNGYYKASQETKEILIQDRQGDINSFWPILRDNFRFFPHYERGVPKPNMCNQNETGSSPFLWPLGARTINYRWDRKDGLTRYSYLVPNPVVWLVALISLVVAGSFWIASVLGGLQTPKNWRLLAGAFLLIWASYMAAMLSLDRVMYLYHYFIPLLCALALGALSLPMLQVRLTKRLSKVSFPGAVKALVAILFVFIGFRIYAPFTYGYPISNERLNQLALLDLWDLRCPDCDLKNHIARPTCNPKEKKFPQVKIDSVSATDGFQEWGDPIQGLSVDKQDVTVRGISYKTVIGTHATSTLRFQLSKRYNKISGKAALPDYLKGKSGKEASVEFEIWLDGTQIWGSRKLTLDDQEQDFEVPVVGGGVLELRTQDGGDGINNDHAVWVDLHLR